MKTETKILNRSRSRMLGAVAVLSLCVLAPGVPRAEVTPEMLDMSLEELMSVEIVTASKTGRRSRDVTQKVDVIPGAEITRTVAGSRNIAEYLQYLPGASVLVLSRNDANWGAYGGIGPEYVTYMVQGLPVDAFMDPMGIDPSAIDRIEVQRGPASVLYPNYLSQDYAGNQCPLTGTVNLILKQDPGKPETELSAGYGMYNTLQAAASHRRSIGNAYVSGGASGEKSDYTDYGSDGSWLDMRQDPDYVKGKIFITTGTSLGKDGRHTVSLFGNQAFHRGNTGRPGREYDNRYTLANAVYGGTLADGVRITVKAGIRSYLREWQEDSLVTATDEYEFINTSGVDQTIMPLDASLTYDHFNHSNLTIGSDYQYTVYETWNRPVLLDRAAGNDASAVQMGTYVQEELQAGNLTLRAGGRLNMISHDIRKIQGLVPGEASRSWSSRLWSTGIKYRFRDGYSLYANAGNSFMSPGLKAIGGTLPLSARSVPGQDGQLPNPDLEPENGLGLDLGIDGELPFSLHAGLRAFSTTITDAIIDNVVSLTPSQTISVNASGKTVAQGIEFSLGQYAGKTVDWFVNGTYTRSEIVAPDDADQDGNEIPFVPAVIANAGITAYLPWGIELTPRVHYSGRIYDSSSRAARTAYDIGELVNLQAAKSFTLPADRAVDIRLDLYNITDNRFDMPWAFRNTGIHADLNVRLLF